MYGAEWGFRTASSLEDTIREDTAGAAIEHPRLVQSSKATAIDQPIRPFVELYGKQRLGTRVRT